MNPLVSFIIPAYNHARFMREGIASITTQSIALEYEIIVVDDASSDDTSELVRSYSDPRLIYARHERNRGTTATVFHALGLTRGKYVAQLDADDRFRPDFLETVLPIFQEYPDLAMVYGDVAGMDEAGNIFADPWQEHHARRLHGSRSFRGNELVLMMLHSPCSATARLMRGDLARALVPLPDYVDGRFPTAEWLVNVWLARYHEVYYIPRTLADYRLHASNQHTWEPRTPYRETTIFNTLDHLFAEPLEQLRQPGLKARAYGGQYLRLADDYFSVGNFADARRCYLNALVRVPRQFLHAGAMHRLIGTGLGEARYTRTKQRVRSLQVGK